MTRILKKAVAVCIAIVLAVQTAVLAAADIPETEEIFSQYWSDGTGFYDNLQFGDNDWAALCRIRLYGSEGAESYLASVKSEAERLMSSEGFVKPTELQRAAIILAAADECDSTVMNAAVYHNGNFERQGLNAYIWGVIAINCSGIQPPKDALHTSAEITEYLLSRQLADGGFSLKGSSADTDITAAVIYALAPYRDEPDVSSALVRAEQCLRRLQLESGGYMSVGVENCESAAQAVIAFTSLGYGVEDEQVRLALDAVKSYRTEDSYAHQLGGNANGMAAMQALQAFTALELLSRGESLYSAPAEYNNTDEQSAQGTSDSAIQPQIPADEQGNSVSGDTVRLAVGGALTALGVILAAVLLLLRKRGLLVFPLFIAVAGAVVLLLDIRTPEEYYASSVQGGMEVYVTVNCTAALEYETGLQLPQDGILLEMAVALPEGASAFDALVEAAKPQQLRIGYSGGAFGEYVTEIGGLCEFGCGSESGWIYNVNGEYPNLSAGACTLSAGDNVEFVYTCALGQYPTD